MLDETYCETSTSFVKMNDDMALMSLETIILSMKEEAELEIRSMYCVERGVSRRVPWLMHAIRTEEHRKRLMYASKTHSDAT